MTGFYQAEPALGNQYTEDPLVRTLLRRRLPPAIFAAVDPGLERLGARAATDIAAAGEAAEAAPPRHIPYDAWGRRVDRIETSAGWQTLERIAVEEGIVATAYEREHGPWSRLHQCVRSYLFAPSSALFSCPLAMTDGAARCLELHGDAELRRTVYPHLVSRDPATFWTSGQWMTERTGGPDVSETSTIARPDGDGFRLYGTKWFTSATTSQLALTLARIDGAPSGTRGLSLFCVELRDADGALRGIRIHRLKDKLGTRALPTAELSLEGTPATLVGGQGSGVAKIAAVLNITRIANACAAAAGMRRAVQLARDYAVKRRAFGRRLIDLPLHLETLAQLEVETHAACHLVFHAAELLGRQECGVATPGDSALLRLLTPIVKLMTAKQAVAVASEALEAFGGAGYIEDTGLPRLLRDAQVLPIWEGTTNVLSLDVLRAIGHDGALAGALPVVRARLRALHNGPFAADAARVAAALDRIEAHVAAPATADLSETGARALALSIGRMMAGLLLLEHAAWAAAQTRGRGPAIVARRWCHTELAPLLTPDAAHLADTVALVGSRA
jgi:alkylation response protein AidB-like acyl-CoA dehydrogenase